MIDFVAESEDDKLKFLEHFPLDGDVTLQVLKGHLLLEEILRDIFSMQLPLPSALNGKRGTSFDCHQIICLCEAITPRSQTIPWIWTSAKKLNNLRNDLAHQLSPKGLDNKVTDLINYVKKGEPGIELSIRGMNLPKGNDLVIIIVSMCSCLSTIKTVLEHQENVKN